MSSLETGFERARKARFPLMSSRGSVRARLSGNRAARSGLGLRVCGYFRAVYSRLVVVTQVFEIAGGTGARLIVLSTVPVTFFALRRI